MREATELGSDDPIPGTENVDKAERRTETRPTGHGSDDGSGAKDVVTDPAHDDRVGSDWSDEGGAVPRGPATHTPAPADDDNDEGMLTPVTLDPPD